MYDVTFEFVRQTSDACLATGHFEESQIQGAAAIPTMGLKAFRVLRHSVMAV
jgi:hypothetical protein